MIYEFFVIDLRTGSQIIPIDVDEILFGVFPVHFTIEDVVSRLKEKFYTETGIDIGIVIQDNYEVDVFCTH